jgi:hypothetical protein
VLRNLNREIKRIRGRSRRGMHKAVLIVKAAALPKTPVDTGHLRSSAYTNVFPGRGGVTPALIGEIGYTASYAVYVHEINKAYRAGGTGWKYLERALKEKSKEVLEAIRSTVKRR